MEVPAWREPYLRRLGLEVEPPSVGALFRLHRAHVERVPYETLWIHVGERWGIGLEESTARIAHRRRGGYCFMLNGALSVLLEALGYRVERHVGGVHGPAGPTEDELTNHLVLTVAGLPSEDNPEGRWYVDAGLGDALHEPLALRPDAHRQGPFELVLSHTPGQVGDWHLRHDPAGTFAGMTWRSATATMAEFQARHEWLSTSPESGFVRFLNVQRRDATGVDLLRGLTLRRIGVGASETVPHTAGELADCLGDIFAIDVAGIDPVAFDQMWQRTYAAHLAWLADH